MRFSSMFENAHAKAQESDGTEDDVPEILYDATIHGHLRRFEGGDTHQRLLNQFRDKLEALQGFLVVNDKAEGARRLEQYWERLKLGSDYPQFGDDVAAIYSEGMMALHRIEQLSRDEDIPLDERVAKIDNVSQDMLVCANGGLSNLQGAVGDLRLSRTSLKMRAMRLSLRRSEAFIKKYVEDNFAPPRTSPEWRRYAVWEVHLVNLFKTKSAHFLWGDLTDDSAVAAEGLFGVRQDHITACARIHDENVNAKSIVADLTDSCMKEIQKEYGYLAGKVLTSDELNGLVDIYKETFQPKLTPDYGQIKLDHVFSSSYLPRPLRNDSTEDRALLKDVAILERRIADNLAAVGVLDDYGPMRLTNASAAGEVLEESDGTLLVNKPKIDELRKVEVEDLEWIGEQWRSPDRETFLNIARRLVEERAGVGLTQALGDGDAVGVRRFSHAIQSLNDGARAELLETALDEEGRSALFNAMRDNHVDAVRAYAVAVRTVPLEMRSKLLNTGRFSSELEEEAESGIALAVSHGRAEMVRAYTEAIRGLSPDQRALLIDPFDPIGQSCLATALRHNHAEAIRAYSEALHQVPPEIRDRYLDAYTYEDAEDGSVGQVPGLHHALANGSTESVRAYIAAIAMLSPEAQVRILERASPGLDDAVRRGFRETVEAYAGAPAAFPPDIRRRLLRCGEPTMAAALATQLARTDRAAMGAYLQAAWSADPDFSAKFTDMEQILGEQSLRSAFASGDTQHVRTYLQFVEGLGVGAEAHAQLLTRPEALRQAVENGYLNVIRAYASAIGRLEPEHQARVFSKAFGQATPQSFLGTALSKGEADKVVAYIAALQPLHSEVRGTYLTPEKARSGRAALAESMEKGFADAVGPYVAAVASLDHPEAGDLQTALLEARPEEDSSDDSDDLDRPQRDRPAGSVGVGYAVKARSAAAIGAYLAGLQPLSAELRKKLARSEQANGEPAICIALDRGDSQLVKAFADNTRYLDKKDSVALLSGDDSRGVSRLAAALERKNDPRVRSCIKAFEDLDHEVKIELLSAKGAGGEGFLQKAFDRGVAEDVTYFVGSMLHRPSAELEHLLAARNREGRAGLMRAIEGNRVSAVMGFRDAITSLPSDLQAELLMARDAEGEPALTQILRSPKTDRSGMQSDQAAISLSRSEKLNLYKKALERLPDSVNTEVLLARNRRGEPLLPNVAASGSFDMVRRYAKFAAGHSVQKQLLMFEARNTAGQSAVECVELGQHRDIADLLTLRISAAREEAAGMLPPPARTEPLPLAPHGHRRRRDEFTGDSSEPIDLTGSDDVGRRVRRRLDERDRSRQGGRGA